MVGKLHAGHLGGISYGEVIRVNVNRKWKTQELKEIWYAKLTMARRKKLVKAFNRQNRLCCFCSEETWLAVEGLKKQNPPPGMLIKKMATADHIIPQMFGGTDRHSNIAMACKDCNNRRGTIPFEEFLEARSDPAKWHVFNSKKERVTRDTKAANLKKSEVRRSALIWKLAVLFYVLEKYPTSAQ